MGVARFRWGRSFSGGLPPVPWHQSVDLIGLGLARDHALEDTLDIGERLDVIEAAGLDDR